MSRIAQQKISIPAGVECSIVEERVFCKGPNGSMFVHFPKVFNLNIDNNICKVERSSEDVPSSLWGSIVSNLKNAIIGVTTGFKQEINFVGVGYKGVKNGNIFEVLLGYSHPIKFEIPEGVNLEVKKPNEFVISSHDKQLLGETCARLESLRKVEPYKGKGVVKVGKFYVRKEGKKK